MSYGVIIIFSNLPTDNLYKFMALSGLFIIIFTIYTVENKVEDLDEAIHIEELNFKIFEVKTLSSIKRAENLEQIIQNSIDEKNGKYSVREDKLTIRFSENELKKLINEIRSKKLESDLEAIQREAAAKRIAKLNNKLIRVINWSYFFISLGVILTYVGFHMWYIKVQKPLDSVVSKDAMEGE